jgi:hypothetical protein
LFSSCRGNVKRSCSSKVESSCWHRASWGDEKPTGVVDEREGSGSVEGLARSREGTPHAEASGEAVEAERALIVIDARRARYFFMKLRSSRERRCGVATEPKLLSVEGVSFKLSVALGRREADRWYGAERRQRS